MRWGEQIQMLQGDTARLPFMRPEALWICVTVRIWNAEAGVSQGGNDLTMTRINAVFTRSADQHASFLRLAPGLCVANLA